VLPSPANQPHGPFSLDSDNFPSLTGVQPAISSVLTEWKTARGLLSEAIQSYLAACATLHTCYAASAHNPRERYAVKEALDAVEHEKSSLRLEGKSLRNARTLLAAFSKKSGVKLHVTTCNFTEVA
ncbi:hypothetical protein FRC07_010517, partial [Ceratobasidium sp. 392]